MTNYFTILKPDWKQHLRNCLSNFFYILLFYVFWMLVTVTCFFTVLLLLCGLFTKYWVCTSYYNCTRSTSCQTCVWSFYKKCVALFSKPNADLSFWTDIPMSVGIIDPRTNPNQLNAAEFLWDVTKRASVFVQVKII